jgi:hypothetical protein
MRSAPTPALRDSAPRLRGWLSALILPLLVVVACSEVADSGGGDGGGDCPEGERLVDGECTGGRGGGGGGRDGGGGGGGDDTGESDTGGGGSDAGDAGDTGGACTPGDRVCTGPTSLERCEPDGSTLSIECGAGQVCREGSCTDGTSCSPGEYDGCDPFGAGLRVCNDAGDDWEVEACPEEAPNCLPGTDECSDRVCTPGTTRCVRDTIADIEVCSEDGTAWEFSLTCSAGLSCSGGSCLSPCEENAKVPSFLGCDYWALDLDNIEERCSALSPCREGLTCNTSTGACEPSAASQQFSISVSNPNEDEVIVTITNGSTGAETEVTVPALTVQQIPLARLDVDGTGITNRGYHITTTLPITVHQFNPANNSGVFSNDASLLLPSNAGGLEYYVLGWPTGPFASGTAASYATVVAVGREGTTTVTITPSTTIAGGGGVPNMAPNEDTVLTLEYGQVLNLQAQATRGRDLSGTQIRATQPILVFAGHECAFVLDEGPTPYCDHIEQQLFPVETWGTQYYAPKFAPRGTEVDVYRVVAAAGGTELRTYPPITGVDGLRLARGRTVEFTADHSFSLSASAPVLLGQFMTGSNYPGIEPSCFNTVEAPNNWCSGLCPFSGACDRGPGFCAVRCSGDARCAGLGDGLICGPDGYCAGASGVGDPAFVLSVPVNQYREDYIFLTPSDYREDWFSAVFRDGTTLVLDGEDLDLSSATRIEGTEWNVYHHSTAAPEGATTDPAQAHTITGSEPFGLQVYGYDCDVSYAYPGGLNLTSDEDGAE